VPRSSDRESRESRSSIQYVDRRSGDLREEVVLGEGFVRWVYESAIGGVLRRSMLTRLHPSKAYGRWQSSSLSKRAIPGVVKQLSIDMSECIVPDAGFTTFNDFFTRRLRPGARPVVADPRRLASPADGRTFAYVDVDGDTLIPAKGRNVSLRELLADDAEAKHFAGGTVIIVRLCPADYHRFHFPCAGIATPARTIAGPLESVSPIALARGHAILDTNKRDLAFIDSPVFGRVAYLEIGAMFVGSIVQTYTPGPVAAGDEKGFFEFGGSTVILVLEAGRVKVDPDLVDNTRRGVEVLLRMGEGIATAEKP
jgi:phosphatidylserine decarboxylase